MTPALAWAARCSMRRRYGLPRALPVPRLAPRHPAAGTTEPGRQTPLWMVCGKQDRQTSGMRQLLLLWVCDTRSCDKPGKGPPRRISGLYSFQDFRSFCNYLGPAFGTFNRATPHYLLMQTSTVTTSENLGTKFSCINSTRIQKC